MRHRRQEMTKKHVFPACLREVITLEDILEHLNEAICVINRERKVIYWNQKAEELYGIK